MMLFGAFVTMAVLAIGLILCRPRTMPILYAAPALASSCTLLVMGIIGACNSSGHLDPSVAPIVSGIEQLACDMVPVFAPNTSQVVGTICRDFVPLANGVMQSFTDTDMLVGHHPCLPNIDIVDSKGRGVGKMCPAYAEEMNRKIKAVGR